MTQRDPFADDSAEPGGPLDGQPEGGLVAVPGYQTGGYVERTGIALVHQGEYILPAPGSEAVISGGGGAHAGQVVNYYFPIEVQVIGAPSRETLRQLAEFVYDELLSAFNAR